MLTCTRGEKALLFADGAGTLRVSAPAANTFRITWFPGEATALPDYGILSGSPAEALPAVEEGAEGFRMTSGGAVLQLDGASGAITLSREGRVRTVLSRPAFTPAEITRFVPEETHIRLTADGEKTEAGGTFVPVRTVFSGETAFRLSPEEALYGLGSQEEGLGDLRGHIRYLYPQNMKAVVPVLLSTAGWGCLFHCGCAMIFDGQGGMAFDCLDCLDVFLMAGNGEDWFRVYDGLTGTVPLPPRYAFGFIQSKECYHTSAELLDVAGEYRRRGLPLSVIVQDWQSWKPGEWGDKTPDPARFPNVEALTAGLHAQNVRLMVSIWPSMSAGRDRREMEERGFMLGNGSTYNAFDPAARALYWQQVRRGWGQYGTDCWWCDCTEPFEADWTGAVKPSEAERYRINTAAGRKYLPRDKIQLYSLHHSRGVWEGHRGDTGKRVLNLTRSSYAGQHRYGTVTWSGDISATWETLAAQIPEGCNFAATGERYWTLDIGGFFAAKKDSWFWAGDYDRGVEDPAYRELFIRWLEYGCFLPLMRAHGTDTPREIWYFGQPGEPCYEAYAATIRLRERLLPTLYSRAAAQTLEHGCMMLPPGLVWPEDAAARALRDEYLFCGMLVCPVTRPGVLSRQVTLPAGRWYDFYSGAPVEAGTFEAAAPLDSIPVFLPAGLLLFTREVLLTVTVCTGADGEGVYYTDDGETCAYEAGEYRQTIFRWQEEGQRLTLTGDAPEEEIRLRLLTPSGIFMKNIQYTGKKCDFTTRDFAKE